MHPTDALWTPSPVLPLPAVSTPGPLLSLTDDEAHALGSGGIVLRDAFVDRKTALAARDVLDAWNEDGVLTPAGVGRDAEHRGIRGDLTTWVEPGGPAPLAALHHVFEQLRSELSYELRLGLQRFSVQAARYGAGAGYKRHLDAFRGDPSRILTAIVYLNPDWQPADGGQLRAWVPEGPVDVEPQLGRLLLFRSDAVPHAVLPAHAPRFAVTAWYRGAEPVPLLPDPE